MKLKINARDSRMWPHLTIEVIVPNTQDTFAVDSISDMLTRFLLDKEFPARSISVEVSSVDF